MASERYTVRVMKDSLVFSAAHFITFADGQCERLHGHNYRVEVEVEGPLDANHYVVDFIALRDEAKRIVDRLDHHVLLPELNPQIRVRAEDRRVVARFEDREWTFPIEDCVLLPIANTTAELLARWIGQELDAAFRAHHAPLPAHLRVRVEENFGQWATWAREP